MLSTIGVNLAKMLLSLYQVGCVKFARYSAKLDYIRRLMRGVFSNANEIHLFLDVPPHEPPL